MSSTTDTDSASDQPSRDEEEEEEQQASISQDEQRAQLPKVHSLVPVVPGAGDSSSSSLDLDYGENWLRLTESRHCDYSATQQDDTDDDGGLGGSTQQLDDAERGCGTAVVRRRIYPSVLILNNLGHIDAPTDDCFLCIDVVADSHDNNHHTSIVFIKDFRPPVLDDNSNKSTISSTASTTITDLQISIFRHGQSSSLLSYSREPLERRQLTILRPGDKICIRAEETDVLVFKYTFDTAIQFTQTSTTSTTSQVNLSLDQEDLTQNEAVGVYSTQEDCTNTKINSSNSSIMERPNGTVGDCTLQKDCSNTIHVNIMEHPSADDCAALHNNSQDEVMPVMIDNSKAEVALPTETTNPPLACASGQARDTNGDEIVNDNVDTEEVLPSATTASTNGNHGATTTPADDANNGQRAPANDHAPADTMPPPVNRDSTGSIRSMGSRNTELQPQESIAKDPVDPVNSRKGKGSNNGEDVTTAENGEALAPTTPPRQGTIADGAKMDSQNEEADDDEAGGHESMTDSQSSPCDESAGLLTPPPSKTKDRTPESSNGPLADGCAAPQQDSQDEVRTAMIDKSKAEVVLPTETASPPLSRTSVQALDTNGDTNGDEIMKENNVDTAKAEAVLPSAATTSTNGNHGATTTPVGDANNGPCAPANDHADSKPPQLKRDSKGSLVSTGSRNTELQSQESIEIDPVNNSKGKGSNNGENGMTSDTIETLAPTTPTRKDSIADGAMDFKDEDTDDDVAGGQESSLCDQSAGLSTPPPSKTKDRTPELSNRLPDPAQRHADTVAEDDENEINNHGEDRNHDDDDESTAKRKKRERVVSTRQTSRKKAKGKVAQVPKTPDQKPSARLTRSTTKKDVLSRTRPDVSIVEESGAVKILVTGITVDQELKKWVKKLPGASLIKEVAEAHKATHVIVADGNIPRTTKMRIALCNTPRVVKLKWLEASSRSGTVEPWRDYSALEQEVVERISTNVSKNRRLLDNWSVYVCSDVSGNDKVPPLDEIKLIIHASGARLVKSLPRDCTKVLLLTSEPETAAQKKESEKAMKKGATKRTIKSFLDLLLSQKELLPDADKS